jgi:DNA-binding NarL/FixJ family response regulator
MSNEAASWSITQAMAAPPLAVSLADVMINVSIVEDDAKLRATLERYLMTQPGFRCVSVYPNAEAALAGIPKVNPHVVLMDINLPGMNGIECVARLRHSVPAAKIIMLTVFEEGEQVFNALSAGAFGYLVKSSRPAKILEAIREVHGGGSPMSGNIARKVVQTLQAQAAAQAATRVETDTLSARELEVLQALSKGHTYKQIAADLGISLGTVRTYIQRIYEKLHVHSHAEAVMKFARK